MVEERLSSIPDLTSRTTRRLELVHLDISEKFEESLHGYSYTVAFIDDFNAKSDDMFARTGPNYLIL